MGGSALWLDGLYIRLTTPRAGEMQPFIEANDDAAVWMTGLTLQGNGDGVSDGYLSGGLFSRGSMYAEGAAAANFIK